MANDLDTKPVKLKIAIPLSIIEVFEFLESINITSETNPSSLDKIFEEIVNYYEPKTNVIIEQFKFFRRCQVKGESFYKFLREICNLAKRYEFGDFEDNMVRIGIVFGVNDIDLQERLFKSTRHKSY
ncbi:Hypothetical protein CINCED_3A018000 [Cinara cedri]|uniref:Uncharacterized protein n=1 Tax=Cinara cedri TaxID=506608 RepID=A0A5E4MSW6_9HEMI|nr:Hypothetical protein CINCED_3A018000 [Cinara cedri]